MSTLALKVDVDDTALGRLRSSVRELSTSFKSLGAEVGRSGSDAAKASLAQTETSLKAVKSATQALSRSAKQATDDYAKGFNSLLPVLDKIATNLDRVAAGMERLSARSTRALQQQKQAVAEVVEETNALTKAESTLAQVKTRTATAVARKASQSISATDQATGYRYSVSSKALPDETMAVINSLRKEADLRKLGLAQIAAKFEDEVRTRSLGVSQARALQEDEQRTRALGIAQVRAAQEDEERTRRAGLLQVRAQQEDEGRTRTLGLAQIRAAQEDEERTRKLGLVQIRATQEDEKLTRDLGLMQLKAQQDDEKRTRNLGLMMTKAQEEDELRVRKLALQMLAAQLEDERRTRRQGVAQDQAARMNDKFDRTRGLEMQRAQEMMEDEFRKSNLQILKAREAMEKDIRDSHLRVLQAQSMMEKDFSQRQEAAARAKEHDLKYSRMSEKQQLGVQEKVRLRLDEGADVDDLTARFGHAAVTAAGLATSVHEITGSLKRLQVEKTGSIDSTRKFTEAQHALHSTLRGVGGGLDHLWLTYGKYASAMAAAYAVTQTVRQSFTKGLEFEYQTHFTSAVSNEGYSPENVERIRAGLYTASDLEGVYASALELSKGLRVMQQAGLDASVALDSIGTAAKVALIGESDLKTASEDLVGVLDIFGMHSDQPKVLASNFQRAGDVMAYVANETKANMHDVAESFKNVIGVTEAYGAQLDTVAALTEKFGKAGVVGPKAGTFTRNFLDEALGLGTKKSQGIREALGLEQFDKSKHDVEQYIDSLVKKLRELNATSQTAAIEGMFGERGQRLIRIMIGDMETLAEAADRVGEKSIGMADQVAKTLGKDTKIMFQRVAADFDNALSQAFAGSSGALQDLARAMSQLFKSEDFQNSLKSVVNNLAEFGQWIVRTDNSLVILTGSALTFFSILRGGIAIKAAQWALNLAKESRNAATAVEAVTAASTILDSKGKVFSTMAGGAEAAATKAGTLNTALRGIGSTLGWIAGLAARHPVIMAILAGGAALSYWNGLDEQRKNWVTDATERAAGQFGLPKTAEERALLDRTTQEQALALILKRETVLSRGDAGAQAAVLKPLQTLRAELENNLFKPLSDYMPNSWGESWAPKDSYALQTTGAKNLVIPNENDPAARDATRQRLEAAKTAIQDLKNAQQEALSAISVSVQELAIGPIEAYAQRLAEINSSYAQMSEGLNQALKDPTLRGSDRQRLETERAKLEGDRLKALRDAQDEQFKAQEARAKKLEDLEVQAGKRVLSAQELWARKYASDYTDVVVQTQTDFAYVFGLLREAEEKAAKATAPAEVASAQAEVARLRQQLEALGQVMSGFSTNVDIALWAEGVKEHMDQAAEAIEGTKAKLEVLGERSEREGLLGLVVGNAKNFSAERNKLVDQIRNELAYVRQKIAEGGDAQLVLSLKVRADRLESELEKAEKTIDPTLARWGDTMGDYLAQGLVYGFDQGESPAKAFANMLRQEIYRSIASALSQQFRLALDVLLGGVGGGGIAGGGGGGGGGLLGTLSNLSSLSNLGSWASNFGMMAGSFGAGTTMTATQLSNLANAGLVSPNAAAAGWLGANVAPGLAAYSLGQKYGVVGGLAGGVGTSALVGGLGGLASGAGFLSGAGAALGALGPVGWAMIGVGAILGGVMGNKKPSDKTAWASVDPTTGLVSGIGSMTGKKDPGQEARDQTAALAQLIGQFAGLAGISASITAMTGGRDGTRLKINRSEGTLGFRTPGASIANGGNALNYGYGESALRAMLNDLIDEGTLPQATIDAWKGLKNDARGVARSAEELISTLNLVVGGYSYIEVQRADLLQAEGETLEAALGRVLNIRRALDTSALPGDDLAKIASEFVRQVRNLGAAVPKTGDEFLTLVDGLDISTASGRNLYTSLMALAPAFVELQVAQRSLYDQLLSEEELVARGTEALGDAFKKLGVAAPQSASALRSVIDAQDVTTQAGAALRAQLLALVPTFVELAASVEKTREEAVNLARSNLEKAYRSERDELEKTKASLERFVESVRKARDDLRFSDLSTLNPVAKYALAKQQFDQDYLAASTGDEDAQGRLISSAQQFLQESRSLYASGDAYGADFEKVMQILGAAETMAGVQMSEAERSITLLEDQVKGLIDINESVLSVKDAILALQSAEAMPTMPQFASGGLHDGGIRLVGERGPEVEVTGPARYWNFQKTREMFGSAANNDALVSEVRALRDEVAGLRRQQAQEHREAVESNYEANDRAASKIAEKQEQNARRDRAAMRYA